LARTGDFRAKSQTSEIDGSVSRPSEGHSRQESNFKGGVVPEGGLMGLVNGMRGEGDRPIQEIREG